LSGGSRGSNRSSAEGVRTEAPHALKGRSREVVSPFPLEVEPGGPYSLPRKIVANYMQKTLSVVHILVTMYIFVIIFEQWLGGGGRSTHSMPHSAAPWVKKIGGQEVAVFR